MADRAKTGGVGEVAALPEGASHVGHVNPPGPKVHPSFWTDLGSGLDLVKRVCSSVVGPVSLPAEAWSLVALTTSVLSWNTWRAWPCSGGWSIRFKVDGHPVVVASLRCSPRRHPRSGLRLATRVWSWGGSRQVLRPVTVTKLRSSDSGTGPSTAPAPETGGGRLGSRSPAPPVGVPGTSRNRRSSSFVIVPAVA